MTIGIAAFGPNAGMAVFKALRAVERVAHGSIGGFASFVAVTAESVSRHETQRGGTRTLFTSGESTGVDPDGAIAAARLAGVMSSGPDRPEPLAQFTPAVAGIGLVTGHRLPNMPGADGVPINTAVLELMGAGFSAKDAIDSVLSANPEADVGLIAGSLGGGIYSRNSARVTRRPDLGHARCEADGAVVEVLHNAIYPVSPLANLAVEIALDAMLRRLEADAEIIVRAGTPIVVASEDRVLVDANLVTLEIQISDARLSSSRWNCAAIYLGARVILDDTEIGTTMDEPNMIVEDGKVISMSGQSEIRLGVRKRREIV